MSNILINPTSGSMGVEIHNVDLSKELSDSLFSEIRETFIAHGLIFFRDQELTPDDHLRFAKRWGEININRFFVKVEGYDQIAEVRKDADQKINIGGAWHTDHSYDQVPAMGSILLAKETPKIGGDTLFANMYRAYETLSDGMKKTLESMKACHSSRHVFGAHTGYSEASNQRIGNPELATQDAIHPVIITHPESKRKALYVNPEFTVNFEGWTVEESKPLLDYLTEHTTQQENTTRFQWEPGSIAFWDNRCTWHFALNDYPGETRLMHRITVEGSALS
ncbi:MAG TPA: TauD/TfdA family dioxygenase [Nitrospinaceae bacterium]|jgi:taurine dioxygenase|nr:TauD/TfdA family dioxygenase [Gammaproteobacteria bacterium]HIO23918.1 TauD/TfdA family dioxygenase [Nitrospinaceae bacterium]